MCTSTLTTVYRFRGDLKVKKVQPIQRLFSEGDIYKN